MGHVISVDFSKKNKMVETDYQEKMKEILSSIQRIIKQNEALRECPYAQDKKLKFSEKDPIGV